MSDGENPCASVEAVLFRELEAYADQVAGQSGLEIVPITRSRARCVVKNPDADPADLALLILRDKHREIIGYWGFMPSYARVDGRLLKVSFSSTGFIKEELRRTGVTQKAFAAAKQHIKCLCATGNSPDADRMYRFLGFEEAAGFNAWILRSQLQRARRLMASIALRLGRRCRGDSTMMPPAFPSLTSWAAGSGYKLQEHVASLPESCADLLMRPKANGHLRSPERIRWMLSDPWWPAAPALNTVEERYYFAWKEKKIRFRVFELKEKSTNRAAACMIIAEVRDPASRIKLLDYGFSDPALTRLGPLLACELAYRQRADQVLIPPELCTGLFWSAVCAVFGRKHQATYFTYAPDVNEARAIVNLPHRLTDGDTPFW
jgi:hypothetical protein